MGVYQLLYSYELPVKRTLDFVRPMRMPVNAIVVLVPENSISIKSAAINDAGVRDVQGMVYRLYSGSGFAPGDELRMTITRSTSFFASNQNMNLLLGLSVLGLVLFGSGIWLYRKNRHPRFDAPLEDSAGAPVAAFESREAVMDAILALDDLYQEGKLPEEAYRKRRAQLKDQLKEMVDRQD